MLATISDGCCTIKASFFFDPKNCLKAPDAGDKVRLIGTEIQEWCGHLQLGGKNIQFGDPVVFMSLSDAIAAWNAVKAAGAQRYFPKLTTVVAVVSWGNATASRGAQLPSALLYGCLHQFSGGDVHVSAQLADADRTIRGSFFFDSHDCLENLAAGDTCQLVGVEMQEWNGCVQLSGKNVSIVPVARA